jgi:hypothetical protein
MEPCQLYPSWHYAGQHESTRRLPGESFDKGPITRWFQGFSSTRSAWRQGQGQIAVSATGPAGVGGNGRVGRRDGAADKWIHEVNTIAKLVKWRGIPSGDAREDRRAAAIIVRERYEMAKVCRWGAVKQIRSQHVKCREFGEDRGIINCVDRVEKKSGE